LVEFPTEIFCANHFFVVGSTYAGLHCIYRCVILLSQTKSEDDAIVSITYLSVCAQLWMNLMKFSWTMDW